MQANVKCNVSIFSGLFYWSLHLPFSNQLLSSHNWQFDTFNIVLAYLFSPLFLSLQYSPNMTMSVWFFFLFYLLFYFFFISPLSRSFSSTPPDAASVTFLPSFPTSSSSWTVCCAPQPLGLPLESRTPLKVPHPNACKMGVRTWKVHQGPGRYSSSPFLNCQAFMRAPGQQRPEKSSEPVSPKNLLSS